VGREPCSGYEVLVADRLETVMLAEGISPGERECHDAQPGRRRVDWIYPAARPRPFALEVTSIVAAVDRSGDSAIMKLGERLTRLAEGEGLGAWIVSLRTDRPVRAMEDEVAKILRDAQVNRERLLQEGGFIRPGWYTSDDLMRLPREQWGAYIAEHDRVKSLGIQHLTPIHSERENVVFVVPTRGAVIESFAPELFHALEEKREVLGLEHDLEGHLGVLVERWDRSNEPQETPVPEFPAEIDVLWIVHAWFELGYPVWVARRGETMWRVYEIPRSTPP
jgi:hypothetical protein